MDELNQLLAYHEVFGKLQGEIGSSGQTNNAPAQQQNVSNNIGSNIAIVTPKTIENEQQVPSTSGVTTENGSAIITTSNHVCDICGKMFQYRYQLIVHRRYHTERKPFTCQVSFK